MPQKGWHSTGAFNWTEGEYADNRNERAGEKKELPNSNFARNRVFRGCRFSEVSRGEIGKAKKDEEVTEEEKEEEAEEEAEEEEEEEKEEEEKEKEKKEEEKETVKKASPSAEH
uniref:Uncharacterized protein n=1 Tax=Vespula pensylvanica TaxID=30213 RepID=A0A834NSG4_VESPE|nr:hypothetical protein H0235_011574 [Vespula pensylvanica]